jgi:hypothetical protein
MFAVITPGIVATPVTGGCIAPPAGADGVGTVASACAPGVPAALFSAVVATTGALGIFCRCQASHNMISEKLNTRSSISRRLSIAVSAEILVRK